ncbi:MAG TPA: glycosyltransferase [Acidimicrobiia bacterium]|nr:glycosyltransferase [Acidimicrobiia bacterium]
MLERVPLLVKEIAAYEKAAGVDAVDELRRLAEPFQGARVLHVNATAYGGGVAELLGSVVPLMRDLGLEAEWHVIHGSDEFFGVTKGMHNALQGAEIPWTFESEETYLSKIRENALAFDDGEWDFVIIHDPQPAALLGFLEDGAVNRRGSAKWIWRCHIDLTDANPAVWEFLRPHVERHDASVWTMPEFVPDSLKMDCVRMIPPAIDPLSVKNLGLERPFVDEICRQYGVDLSRPLMCQVSRFDPWKDPVGVIEAYQMARHEVPGLQLLLAGSMATDDPEGFHYWEITEEAAGGDADVHLLSNIQQVGSVQINAFQRAADVIVQKSLREGFGLTVSEGLWKGRPVIGGDCGGIRIQIRDGEDGFLVSSVEECARRTVELLHDHERADVMGASGMEHVREQFLTTRLIADWLRLFGELSG